MGTYGVAGSTDLHVHMHLEARGQPCVLFFRIHLPCILRWGPALGLIEPAAKFGWPVRPGELPVPAAPAYWLHACTTPHLPFMWVLGCWIQGLRLVQQARYPTASHPSSPGLGFGFKWACMCLSTPGSRQPPWNITGYLNGCAQGFISPLPPWLSSKYTCHVRLSLHAVNGKLN